MMKENKAEFSKAVINFFSDGRLHVDLALLENGVVKIQRYDMRSDELKNSFALFDLKKFWLPANGIYDSPTSFLSRDDLVCVILLFLNNFMFRTRSTKGRHNRAKVEAKQCIKFFEYLWLRGYLELSSVPQSLMMEFAEDVAKVGWIGVLNIESRLHELVAKYPQRPRMNREEFSQLLATNIEGSDFGIIYGVYLSLDFDDNESSIVEQPLGYSSMRHLLGALNNLYGLSEGLGLKRFPYLNSVALSRTLTSAPQRTPNIGPGDAAVLLSGSFEIVLSYADPIVSLLKDISTLVIDNFKLGRFELGAGIEQLVVDSGINKMVVFPQRPGRNSSDGIGGNYVCALILLIMSACFVILAVCNARRRDEIQHKKYGVHVGCASIMNEELGLYTAEFYIEKTLLDYSVFFINTISFRVIKILESVQAEFHRVDRALGRYADTFDEREKNLFAYRRLSELDGIGKKNCWFNFSDAKRGYVQRYLEFIFPSGNRIEVSAHMFRRLYGLLFMYRHELPEVQALSYQFQHDCFSATVTYITDPAIEDDLNSIYRLYNAHPDTVKKAYYSHCEDVQETLRGIAKERMAELVEHSLGGGTGRGGFTKFLKAVYRKYLTLVEFVDLSFEAQAKIITDRFLTRGHLPNPFRHSICVASPNKLNSSAHCSSAKTKALRPELASPTVCHGCPFQYLNDQHIDNMVEDRKALLAELDRALQGSPIAQQLREQIVNIQKIIEYHDHGRVP